MPDTVFLGLKLTPSSMIVSGVVQEQPRSKARPFFFALADFPEMRGLRPRPVALISVHPVVERQLARLLKASVCMVRQ